MVGLQKLITFLEACNKYQPLTGTGVTGSLLDFQYSHAFTCCALQKRHLPVEIKCIDDTELPEKGYRITFNSRILYKI